MKTISSSCCCILLLWFPFSLSTTIGLSSELNLVSQNPSGALTGFFGTYFQDLRTQGNISLDTKVQTSTSTVKSCLDSGECHAAVLSETDASYLTSNLMAGSSVLSEKMVILRAEYESELISILCWKVFAIFTAIVLPFLIMFINLMYASETRQIYQNYLPAATYALKVLFNSALIKNRRSKLVFSVYILGAILITLVVTVDLFTHITNYSLLQLPSQDLYGLKLCLSKTFPADVFTFFPNSELSIENNVEDCISSLREGDIDVVITSNIQLYNVDDSETDDLFLAEGAVFERYRFFYRENSTDHNQLETVNLAYLKSSSYFKLLKNTFADNHEQTRGESLFFQTSLLSFIGITITIFTAFLYVLMLLCTPTSSKMKMEQSLSLSTSNFEENQPSAGQNGQAPSSWIGGRGIHSASSRDIAEAGSLLAKYQNTQDFEQQFSSISKISHVNDKDGSVRELREILEVKKAASRNQPQSKP